MASRPRREDEPAVLGWHDSHCASAALLSGDGRVLYAAAEERFSKRKLHKGYPARVLADIGRRFGAGGLTVCYADLPALAKAGRHLGLIWNSRQKGLNSQESVSRLVRTVWGRLSAGRFGGVVGTDGADDASDAAVVKRVGHDVLCDHHTAHAASAYYLSGFDRAAVVTIDGVGDCLSGAVFEGEGGRLRRRRAFYYNELTVAADYEVFTAMMGFDPDRHCGKITGLSAFGRPNETCLRALEGFFEASWRRGRVNYFDAIHGPGAKAKIAELRALRQSVFGAFSREDLAWAMQRSAERRVLELIREHVPDIGRTDIALAGGVFANVRINQKVKELGFRNVFVQPAMDDGGLSLGVALNWLGEAKEIRPHRLPDVFLGPGYDEAEIEEALERARLLFERVEQMPSAVARLVAEGNVVARFDGRMEFGPRALGHRSILYDTRDPSVNQWLNKRLGRTEFMPFAPATLADRADAMYAGLEGCRHTAEFMTITFDCTPEMKRLSPAVVHVDGTARGQLVTAEANPGFYEIIDEYRKITGIPSVVNTSFNMHESPIVCTPEDAIASFRMGRLDYLAIGPYLVKADAECSNVRETRTTNTSHQPQVYDHQPIMS